MIRLQFIGAVGGVTGSRTLIETENSRFYVDAGLYQGSKQIEEKNYEPFETDPSTIDFILITHAHIDHSGLLPALVGQGFRGNIYCSYSTAELLKILLPDAGRLVEEEYHRFSKKKIRRLNIDAPLFTEKDALATLKQLHPVHFSETYQIKDIEINYYFSGHILGASHLLIKHKGKSLLFSGDIPPGNPILHDTSQKLPYVNYIITESTYSGRVREQEDVESKIIKAIRHITRSGGMLLLPAFAVGRTQSLLYLLSQLYNAQKSPKLPIFVDSPMAVRATQLYGKYPEELKSSVRKNGFFDFIESDFVHLSESVRDSKYLNQLRGPGIIISASGMCHGGRIIRHLYNRIWSKKNYILFVGYQAESTLGRVLLDGLKRVKIYGKEFTVRAHIDSISSLSAHADERQLVAWNQELYSKYLEIIFINHGNDLSRQKLKEKLGFMKNVRIEAPKNQQIYYLNKDL